MNPSVLLGGSVCAGFIVLAACVRFFGRRADEPKRKITALTWGFVAAGLLFGWFAYATDALQREVTLHEVVLECTPDEAGWVGFDVEVEVLHPGVEHSLVLVPRPATLGSASGPCVVAARWVAPDGTALLEEQATLTTGWSNRRAVRKVWNDVTWRFTPTARGLHWLRVETLNPGVRELFVRVEDPEGPGRPRAPGY